MSYLGPKTRNLDPVINYIDNGRAYNSTEGWNVYQNGYFAPTTGTGGSPGSLVLWQRSTTTPLRQGADFNIISNESGPGYGVSYDFTIDNADLAKVLTVTFDYEFLDGIYFTGDLAVYIIQDPNGTPVVIQPAGYQVQSATIGTKMKHVATFQTASNVTSYRLCLHIADLTENFSDFSLGIDNVSVGPQVVQYGAPVTDWRAYTPTFNGFGTVSAVAMFWRRIGDSIEIQGKFTSGTTTAVEARVSFPAGATSAGTDKIPTIRLVGQTQTNTTTGSGISIFNTLVEPSVTYLTFGYRDSANLPLTKQLGTLTGGIGQATSLYALVPIAGWSSTVQMSNDTDTRVVAAKYRSTTTQALSASVAALISTPSAVFDTHGSFNTSTNRFTCPVPGYYRISAKAAYISTAASVALMTIEKNGVGQETFSGFQSGAGEQFRLHGSVLVLCNAGDTLGVQAFSGNATTLNTSGETSFVEFERLSGPSAIAASETVAARYAVAAGVSSSTSQPINFATKIIDTHGAVTIGASWRFTAPISGKYLCVLSGFIQTAGQSDVLFWRNGGSLGFVTMSVPATAYVAGSQILELNAGDYIDVRHQSAITTGTQNQIHIVRIGN